MANLKSETMQPTPYQYVKLGAHLEFLRGVCPVSLMQTTGLAEMPNMAENVPPHRYSAMHVAEALRSLAVLLGEMGLANSARAAAPFAPMLKEIDEYLARVPSPQEAILNDPFADRLVAIAKQLALAVRRELGTAERYSKS